MLENVLGIDEISDLDQELLGKLGQIFDHIDRNNDEELTPNGKNMVENGGSIDNRK